MVVIETSSVQEYLRLLPTVKEVPQRAVWMSYDQEADVMYVNFRKPSVATDSELTADDVIIGFTVLHASQR